MMSKIDLRLENLPQANEVRNFGKTNNDKAQNGIASDFSRLLDSANENQKPAPEKIQDNATANQNDDKSIGTNNKDLNAKENGDDNKDKATNSNGDNNVILALIFPQVQNVQQAASSNGEVSNATTMESAQNANLINGQIQTSEVDGLIANNSGANSPNVAGNVITGEAAKKFEAALKNIDKDAKSETAPNSKVAGAAKAGDFASQSENQTSTSATSDNSIKITPVKSEAGENSQNQAGNLIDLPKGEEAKKSELKNDTIANDIAKPVKLADSDIQVPKVEATEPKLQINNIQAIAATMVKKFQNGDKKFLVRLDPPELGKIEVELKISADNKITALLKSENPQAMGELMKSARDLINSLNQAGFDMKEQDLTFSLNQNGNQNHNSNNNNAQSQGKIFNLHNQSVDEVVTEVATQKPTTIRHETWDRARVSMVV